MMYEPKHLRYERPVVIIDLETTGTFVDQDKIIEISVLKLVPGKEPILKTYRVNPGTPIPAEATALHGIGDADVVDKPNFWTIAPELLNLLGDSDLVGFNVERFDLPLLIKEFKRAGISFSAEGKKVIDVQNIYHKKEPRDLSAAYKFYCDKEHSAAHSSEGDVIAALEILDAQVARYGDLPKDVEGLGAYCDKKDPSWVDPDGKLVWKNGEIIFNFSKYRGKSLKEMCRDEPDFLKWILNTDFKLALKKIIKDALNGKSTSSGQLKFEDL